MILAPALPSGFVGAGAIRVPGRVEKHLDRLAARLIRDQLEQLGGALGSAAIDHEHAIGAEDGEDVGAGARDHQERVGEFVDD